MTLASLLDPNMPTGEPKIKPRPGMPDPINTPYQRNEDLDLTNRANVMQEFKNWMMGGHGTQGAVPMVSYEGMQFMGEEMPSGLSTYFGDFRKFLDTFGIGDRLTNSRQDQMFQAAPQQTGGIKTLLPGADPSTIPLSADQGTGFNFDPEGGSLMSQLSSAYGGQTHEDWGGGMGQPGFTQGFSDFFTGEGYYADPRGTFADGPWSISETPITLGSRMGGTLDPYGNPQGAMQDLQPRSPTLNNLQPPGFPTPQLKTETGGESIFLTPENAAQYGFTPPNPNMAGAQVMKYWDKQGNASYQKTPETAYEGTGYKYHGLTESPMSQESVGLNGLAAYQSQNKGIV